MYDEKLIERLEDLAVMLTGDDDGQRIATEAAARIRELEKQVNELAMDNESRCRELVEITNRNTGCGQTVRRLESELSAARELLERLVIEELSPDLVDAVSDAKAFLSRTPTHEESEKADV